MIKPSRLVSVVAIAVASTVVLAACTITTAEQERSATGSAEITVEHAYGTLELDEAPSRVVTLGLLETDVAIDLGIEPVAIAKFFASPDGISPWLAESVSETPHIIDTTTTGANGADLDLESIAALEPDLIIATTYTQLDTYYDRLSKIAPVLGPADKNYLQLPWREQTRSIATALGKADEAKKRIDEIDDLLSETAREYSYIAGHDYTLSLATPDQIKLMNDPADASVEIMNAFGLTFSEAASKLPGLNDGSGSAGVSQENVSVIDADIMMVGYFGDETRTVWESSTLFSNLSAVKEGGYIRIDLADSTALRNPSPLSIPYLIRAVFIDQIAPILAK